MSAAADSPRVAGVVGAPVGHSLSPLIHRTWAERARLPFHYVPIEVDGGEPGFARAIEGLRMAGFKGVNVTLPFKEEALRLADGASEAARAIGAANMLTFNKDDIHADNSDALGFCEGVKSSLPDTARRALVLGAGGSARAILYALLSLIGIDDVVIVNRTASRANALAAEFAGAKSAAWDSRETAAGEADVIVNTTSIGMARDGVAGGETPLTLEHVRPLTVVCDIVYAPLKTPLLRNAKAKGLPAVDGLEMLMRQAAPGFRAWSGGQAVVDADLRAACEAALNARRAS
ncbi:MAG: shikimate dehydrogenase [Pseudomonadota bacterium]